MAGNVKARGAAGDVTAIWRLAAGDVTERWRLTSVKCYEVVSKSQFKVVQKLAIGRTG